MAVGVFSYGSLIIPESAAAGVGRDVSQGDLIDAVITGFRRVWGVHVPIRMEEDGAEVDGLFYDIEPSKGRYANGIILPVSEAELDSLTKREAQYDAVEVTTHIYAGEKFERVVTFIGSPRYRRPRAGIQSVIPALYESRINTAAKQRGDAFFEQFQGSTLETSTVRQPGKYVFLDPEQARRV